MDCKSTLKKIDLLIDGELDNEEKEILMEHLEKCTQCGDRLQVEKCFREYLQKALVKKQLSPQFAENIRSFVNSHSV